jgi:hypothetical protein
VAWYGWDAAVARAEPTMAGILEALRGRFSNLRS